MKNTLKKICCLVLALSLCVMFFACNNSEDKDEEDISVRTPAPQPVELGGNVTLSTYKVSDSDSSTFLFTQDFALQYPGVEITIDNNYSYDEYFATLDERVENGTIGDVFLVDSDSLAKYVQKGYVMDLTPYLSGLIEYVSGKYNKLVPSELYFKAAYQASLYQGNMYMVPVEYENKAVIVNLDWFNEIGETVPNDAWTWDDVKAICAKLADAGCENPISFDYNDVSIWGSFALGNGAEFLKTYDETTGELVINLTDPKVVSGLKTLADDYIKTGYLSDTIPSDISADDLSKFGIIVISHADLSRWANVLKSDAFEWEFTHFPRFASADGSSFNYNIGVKTFGLAVRVRDYDTEDYTTDEIEMQKAVVAELALYAMVESAQVSFAGTAGARVPALISANLKKFWREYPVSGKNTSVFSLYSDYDFAASLSAYINIESADIISGKIGTVIEKYSKGEGVIEDLLQDVQDEANLVFVK